MSFDRCQFNPIKPDTLNNNQNIYFFTFRQKKIKIFVQMLIFYDILMPVM